MTEQTKYEKLREAVRDYGAAAMQNMTRCKGFGREVLAGFANYIGAPAEAVKAVPVQGEFDPRKDYGEAAFSFHQQPVVRLEPMFFGICLAVQNTDDSGVSWLRTVVRVEVTGDTFDIFIGQRAMLHVPLDYKGKMEPVFEEIYQDLIMVFEKEVAEFKDNDAAHSIGFLPSK